MFVQKQNVNLVNILKPEASNCKLFIINKHNLLGKNNEKWPLFYFSWKSYLRNQIPKSIVLEINYTAPSNSILFLSWPLKDPIFSCHQSCLHFAPEQLVLSAQSFVDINSSSINANARKIKRFYFLSVS